MKPGGESIWSFKCQRQTLANLVDARSRLSAFLTAQPKYLEPFQWSGSAMSRSETLGSTSLLYAVPSIQSSLCYLTDHRRGMSTIVYGSGGDSTADAPRSAGLQRAGTTGGSYLDGWRARREVSYIVSSRIPSNALPVSTSEARPMMASWSSLNKATIPRLSLDPSRKSSRRSLGIRQ